MNPLASSGFRLLGLLMLIAVSLTVGYWAGEDRAARAADRAHEAALARAFASERAVIEQLEALKAQQQCSAKP